MSSTNKTTNLELSQFIGSDKPQWLVDYNGDMAKIDTGFATVKSQADATDLTVASHTSSIANLTQASSDQGSAITALRTDVDGNTGSINTINSLIGNGEPTTTDKTLIGAINELKGDIDEIAPSGGVEADDVAYDNTTSGLTATNVQAAIDEIAQGGSATVEADDVTYDNTSSGLTATDVQAAIDELASGTSSMLNPVSLWANSDDTQSFNGQGVTVANASTYKAFLVLVRLTASAATYKSFVVYNNTSANQLEMVEATSSGVAVDIRSLTISGTSFTFGDASRAAGTTAAAAHNDRLIPSVIYGI